MKTTIKDIDLKGKRVLLRVDFNVPIKDGKIADDTRIMESLNTINYITEQGAKLIICSHLGRPDGKIVPELSLKPVSVRLASLIKAPVFFASDIIGPDAKAKAKALKPGEVLLLENLRFDKGEEDNDPKFAKALASFADIYVNDAFGTAHRKHASTYGVASLLPNAVGFLMGKEIKVINGLLENPKHPFLAILGGAKVDDKIPVIENLVKIVDKLIIGGGMAYTFIKAKGGSIGKSLLDEESVEFAKRMLNENPDKIILPEDSNAGTEYSANAKPAKFDSMEIPDGYIAMDIGPKARKTFIAEIKKAGTIIWNGPVGVYEFDKFAKGTMKIAKAVSKSKAFTFIGGGDSAAAVIKLGYSKKISHISTGGGASLMMLEGKTLPGVEIISELGEQKPAARIKSAQKTPVKRVTDNKIATVKPIGKKSAAKPATKTEKNTVGVKIPAKPAAKQGGDTKTVTAKPAAAKKTNGVKTNGVKTKK